MENGARIIYIAEEDIRHHEMMAWYFDIDENGEKKFSSQIIHGSHLHKLVEPWEIECEQEVVEKKIEKSRKDLQDIEDSLIVLEHQPLPLYYYNNHIGYCSEDEIDKTVNRYAPNNSYELVKVMGKDVTQGRYAIALEKIVERKVISIASKPEKVSNKATVEFLFTTRKKLVQESMTTYENLLKQMREIEQGTDMNKIPYQELYDRNIHLLKN
jgi:hypothetical protein